MGSRGANMVMSRAKRIKSKQQSALRTNFTRYERRLSPTHSAILFKIPPELKGSLSLEELEVKDYDNVTNLFSSHVAKLMEKLQTLKVKSCEKIEEIISKGNEEEVNKIGFPQLESMELEGLPNLGSFYSGIHSVELSFLKDLKYYESNFQLKTSLLECSLNLKEMRINRRDYSTMGDHFTIATIKEQFMLKGAN